MSDIEVRLVDHPLARVYWERFTHSLSAPDKAQPERAALTTLLMIEATRTPAMSQSIAATGHPVVVPLSSGGLSMAASLAASLNVVEIAFYTDGSDGHAPDGPSVYMAPSDLAAADPIALDEHFDSAGVVKLLGLVETLGQRSDQVHIQLACLQARKSALASISSAPIGNGLTVTTFDITE